MKPYELFEILAGTTWRSIEGFGRRRIQLGEDAITSNHLYALDSAGSDCWSIEDTRSQESTRGCDFELWIGSDQVGWRRYAVQAKKIKPSTSRYDSLAHKVGPELQIDILERYAKANRAMPIYCFYNHTDKPANWNCCLPYEQAQFGCTVTPSYVVGAALSKHGARNFNYFHERPETFPWRCLVRCSKFIEKDITGTRGWPSITDYFHKILPTPLNHFRESSEIFNFIDQPKLFTTEVALRPAWVVIIETKSESSVITSI